MSEALDDRVSRLEEWRSRQEIREAVEVEQRKHLDERFDALDKSVKETRSEMKESNKEIKAIFTKIVWAFVAPILAAIGAFVVTGGFTT